MKTRIITIVLLLTSISAFGKSEYKLLEKACRLESDSIFEIFIDHWKENVKPSSKYQEIDSLKTIRNIIYDFYSSRIGEGQNRKYLIFDLSRIDVRVVNSDIEEERLLKDSLRSKTNILNPDYDIDFSPLKDFTYFSDRKVNYEYVLEDLNCNLPYDKVLYLNGTYRTIRGAFVESKKLFNDERRKKFFSDRVSYYWVNPNYGFVEGVTLFSSGEFAIISYVTGSELNIDALYRNTDNGWKKVGTGRNGASLSVRKVRYSRIK